MTASSRPTASQVEESLSGARPQTFWLDPSVPGHEAPETAPPLGGESAADLAVVGGGYAGLWTALLAKERDPGRDVVLIEARTCGWAASGRNGGFCSSSLTHGFGNGAERWPGEVAALERMGRENLDGIEEAVRRYGIDCEFERTGEMAVATEYWQLEELEEEAAALEGLGLAPEVLTASQVRAEVDSPTYVGGTIDRSACAMLHPAKLARGLRAACLRLGVRIHENSPVRSVRPSRGGLRLAGDGGAVTARRTAWATGPFPGPLRRLRHFVAPVYDYALATEPLTAEQKASIGWKGRQGIGDAANLFHYYRLTADDRILWGGHDVVYRYGGRIRPEHDQRPQTFRRLAENFFTTFPQLEGVRFGHSWGGVIDTCSRFCAFFGTAYQGRLAYTAGYTGLGVGATRFGAQVLLDRLEGADTERTRLSMVRGKPIPFPPEPARYAGIGLTLRATAAADRDRGRRNLWLRTLDRFGMGFNS